MKSLVVEDADLHRSCPQSQVNTVFISQGIVMNLHEGRHFTVPVAGLAVADALAIMVRARM